MYIDEKAEEMPLDKEFETSLDAKEDEVPIENNAKEEDKGKYQVYYVIHDTTI